MVDEMDDIDAVREIAKILEKFDDTQRQRILRWVIEKLDISFSISSSQKRGEPDAQSTFAVAPGGGKATDIKSFVTHKNPGSDNQFAATVAYYYQFEAPMELRRDYIDAETLQDACRKVGRERLGDPWKTLRNAHDTGLLDKSPERGGYKLSTVGENLVAMVLPGDGAAKVVKKKRKKKISK